MNMKRNRSTASLFSGAGFGDMGFESAGFDHLLLCEVDPKRTSFTAANFPDAKVLTTNVADNIDGICLEMTERLKASQYDNLFLLYATPPCQGMSKNGIGTILKAMSDGKRPETDKRNRLYLPVLEAVRRQKPTWVFFENVCRLLNFKDVDSDGDVRLIPEIIESELYDLGYIGRFEKVQMADYGVPQTRLRTVGVFRQRGDLTVRSNYSFLPPKVIKSKAQWVTVRDVIGKNEALDAGCKDSRVSNKNPLHRVPKWRDELYFWMENTPEGCTAFENNSCVGCGYENPKEIVECAQCQELLPKPSILKNGERKVIKGFISAYKRMFWDKPASTITTRSAYACSDHKVHPEENRVLSIYEIAKLQGINVESVVWSDSSGKQFNDTLLRELIGESVPPVFTEIVGNYINTIEEYILKGQFDSYVSIPNLHHDTAQLAMEV